VNKNSVIIEGEQQMKRLLTFLIKLMCYAVLFAAIFAASAYGGYMYIRPSGYVNLNSTPPISYTVNSFNRVIDVNTENKEILKGVNVNHKNIVDAVQITIDFMAENGYLVHDSTGFTISVSSSDKDKAGSMTERLNNEIQIRNGKYAGEKIKAGLVLGN